jgi:hypothetical protein
MKLFGSPASRILTTVITNSSAFWDIIMCSSVYTRFAPEDITHLVLFSSELFGWTLMGSCQSRHQCDYTR